jgi:hypothetical protein
MAIAAPEKGAKEGPVVMNSEVLHSSKGISQERLELIKSMDKYAEEQVCARLRPRRGRAPPPVWGWLRTLYKLLFEGGAPAPCSAS